jgi:protein SCO1
MERFAMRIGEEDVQGKVSFDPLVPPRILYPRHGRAGLLPGAAVLILLLAVTAVAGPAGLVERPGGRLPGNIRCVNDKGEEVPLSSLLDRPVVLSLVYYSCEHVCPQVLAALSRLAQDLPLDPAADYRLVTWSFDEKDGPKDAAEAKRNYLRPLPASFPRESWTFLSASAADTLRLTAALGFSFEKVEHGFVHPSIVVVLGPGGRISRYIHVSDYAYGAPSPPVFQPVEIAAALRDATRGANAAGSRAPLLFCFPHRPEGWSGYYGLTALAGGGTLAGLLGLFLYLAVGRRGRKIHVSR